MRELRDESLSSWTTMGVGGPARRVVVAENTDELVDAIREVDDADEPLLVLSGGSNLMIGDEGFAGTVVRVASSGIRVESADRCGGVVVRVAAGECWDTFVRDAVAEGWAGVECLSGIPGLVGATPVQNVGAYGQDVSQTIWDVRVWDREDQCVRTIANADCAFTYRHSRFKGSSRYVVLDVSFQLDLADLSRPVAYADLARGLDCAPGERVPLSMAREAVLDQRRRRGMVVDRDDHDTWSCGSFFTNPVLSVAQFEALSQRVAERLGDQGGTPPRFESDGAVKTSAAWLIERAGFGKGYGLPGAASLSTKHVLALTNRGGASCADLIALAREIRDGVFDAFGVLLVNEPVLVGVQL
ncbi:UDP-N-acetylenolpyruvoylglucosamine reductase [Austwickia sp. TVS 96-490-7B]|uniref:UDP-N-acetylmuramate dehydrogenase n=1 Tax=Austwickia sp. TVS 96-490-7B TaxID=2830843 RepID=UPI001C588E62|nr:UDP-N-acetylmuramate dehydrogenase [Austwickia sp. TVS 96-490-7B]MBW3085704.1 UDP-N-acetylenolpyruvoylglucosamine reductase [Austwickia sp. TVS 96-490-7B]